MSFANIPLVKLKICKLIEFECHILLLATCYLFAKAKLHAIAIIKPPFPIEIFV